MPSTALIMIPAWIDGYLVAVEKHRVHRHGLRHRAVSVFVISGGETLLQRRAADKYHSGGLWANACCTHPHWGEAPLVCAARRLGEELGIDGSAARLRGQVEYRAEVGNGMTEHEVVDIAVLHTPRDIALSPDPAEVAEVKWVHIDELCRDAAQHPERYTPWLRIYLAEHMRTIFDLPA